MNQRQPPDPPDSPAAIRCTACGAEYDLTPQYLVDYAGSRFQCACGQDVEIPVAHGVSPEGPWRDGRRLVVTANSPMPCRCMRCNAAIPSLVEQHLRWQPPARCRGVVGAIDRVARTQFFPVRFGRCPRHRQLISGRALSTLLGLLSGTLVLWGMANTVIYSRHNALAMVGPFIGAAVVGILAIIAAAWPFEAHIVKIEAGRAWLTGFSDSYLATLPDLPPATLPDQP